MYAELRDRDPVHHVTRGGGRDYYVISRHADVLAAAVDTTTCSPAQGPAQGLTVEYEELEAIGLAEHRPLVLLDPPEPLRSEGGGDIVETLFKPLPTMVVAHYLGVPENGRDRFDAWTHAIVSAGSTGEVLGAADAIGELMSYFTELIERRRVEPAGRAARAGRRVPSGSWTRPRSCSRCTGSAASAWVRSPGPRAARGPRSPATSPTGASCTWGS